MEKILLFIISINGRPGLYQLVQVVRGVIQVERLGEEKPRFVISPQQTVTPLDTVMFASTDGGPAVPLAAVLTALYEQHGPTLPISGRSTPPELRALLGAAVPTCDPEQVPLGMLQKLVSWYPLLAHYLVQTLPAPTLRAVPDVT